MQFLALSKPIVLCFEPMNERVHLSAKTAERASGNHQMPLRRGHSPRCPILGRGRILRGWSRTGIEQHKVQRPRLGSGESWPLLFQPRWQRDLPHLALSVLPAAAAGSPFPRRGHLLHLRSLAWAFLPHSQVTFHSQKTIEILRRVSTL